MQVVDPHIHLWDLEAGCYPWLAAQAPRFTGDHRAIARTHRVADFLADAGAIEVLKAVHVDAGHADPLRETRWLQALAEAPGARGLPHGIVAAVDLSRDDAEAMLAAHAAAPNLRGVRQILNVHADPRYDYVGRHFMAERAWRDNFRLLDRFGLAFDLQVYPPQMPAAAALAADHPDTPIVLDHAGMFADRGSVAGWRAWRDGLRLLAARPNVSVKISGLGMFDHAWTRESLRPYVLETIDAFGTGRAMFASNFPVDRLYSSYEALWSAYADIVQDLGAAEKTALFRGNAERVYRL